MQEFRDSIKRPNLKMMWIEEGDEEQAKGICNILNKMITENFSNLKKVWPIQIQEDSRTPNNLDQNRNSPWHIIIKTTGTEKKRQTNNL
jgi:hypothetical protein